MKVCGMIVVLIITINKICFSFGRFIELSVFNITCRSSQEITGIILLVGFMLLL